MRTYRLLSSAALITSLLAALSQASEPASPATTNGDRGIPADAPRAHQRVDTGTPPAAPSDTPADPGAPLPPRPAPFPNKKRLEQTSTPATLPPAQFNPDPGSTPSSAKSKAAPAPFFAGDIKAESPTPVPPPVLPAGPLTRPKLVTEPSVFTANPADVTPLTSDFPAPLPRSDVRSTDYISPNHGHGWHAPESYPQAKIGEGFPPNSKPVPDRWHDVGYTPWRRYTAGDTNEMPFANVEPETWHWYRQSVLKGDLPIHGQDWFLGLTASSESLYEKRDIPQPSGVSSAEPGLTNFLGSYDSTVFVQNIAIDAVLLQGETVYKPAQQTFKLRLVANYNQVDVSAPGLLHPDPSATPGSDDPKRRTDTFLAVQEAFYEYHIADLTPNFDFVAVKAGIQTFNSDFRGFIFNDTQLGVRLLGNQDNNHYQYNFAVFDMREKDTNSELNTFDRRDQIVVVANLYRQDFLVKGYTTALSLHGNFDQADTQFDKNGFIVRPTPLGTVEEHALNVGYLGWAGDGHIDRFNINHAAYYAFGQDQLNGLAGQSVDISAAMGALEVSYDQNWIRYKASVLYATGDKDPTNSKATGFDSIVDNTNFVGGPFSYFVRQGFNLAGTAVAMKQRFSVLPNMRTSKSQGQANFVNPGIILFGVGNEIDLTPRVRLFANVNKVRFAENESLQTALSTNQASPDLGTDLSLGMQWRPLLTDNIIISAGSSVFLPGQGYKDIYRDTTPFIPGLSAPPEEIPNLQSAVIAVTLTY